METQIDNILSLIESYSEQCGGISFNLDYMDEVGWTFCIAADLSKNIIFFEISNNIESLAAKAKNALMNWLTEEGF